MIDKSSSKGQLQNAYKQFIEDVYGPAKKRTIEVNEIIKLVEDSNSKFHVETPYKGDEFSKRTVDYLREYPYKVYIDKNYPNILREMVKKGNGVKILEVGSFLGNEVRGIESYLENNGITEYTVTGVEIEPVHLLIGCLLHKDSPEDHDFYVCDACNMDGIFSKNSFDFVYSEGLLHSLNKERDKLAQLKESRRVLKHHGLLFGYMHSSRDIPNQKILEQVKMAKALYSSKKELCNLLEEADFKDFSVEEIKREHAVIDAIKYKLVFYAK